MQVVPTTNQISKNSRICSIHFEESQYDCISGKRFLKKSAVPSIFPQDIAKFVSSVVLKITFLFYKYIQM